MQKVTQEVFILRVEEIHPEYDFSNSIYVSARDKVRVLCPTHGEFPILPSALFRGSGCNLCGVKSRADKKRGTTEQFIAKAREVWGSVYDYSKSVYVTNATKLTILCPEHGEFEQTPNNHLEEHGCPECGIDRIRVASSRPRQTQASA